MDFVKPGILTLSGFWVWKKKLTLFTLIWFTSILSHSFGNNSSKDQIRSSQAQIHRLQEDLEKLPELNLLIQTQKVQLREMRNEIENKKVVEKKFEIQNSKLENSLKQKTQKLIGIKEDQNKLSKKLDQKNQKMIGLEKKIRELDSQFAKDDLIFNTYKKSIELNEKKMQHELGEKKLEIFKLNYSINQRIEELDILQNKLENIIFELELMRIDLEKKQTN